MCATMFALTGWSSGSYWDQIVVMGAKKWKKSKFITLAGLAGTAPG